MADRYRKPKEDRRSINAKVSVEAYLYINEIAGEMSLGYAIEQLVKTHKGLKSTTKALPVMDTSSRIQ
jgi:hypothetical protein